MKIAPGYKTIWIDGREYIIPAPGTTFTIKEDCNVSDIDWSKAPEGATHYGSSSRAAYFYRIPGELGDYDYWNARHGATRWSKGVGDPSMVSLVARPSPAWPGTGLPPAGTVCEVRAFSGRVKDGEWIKCKVAFIDERGAYLHSDHLLKGDCLGFPLENLEFRPIKTKAQIEAEAVNQAIKEIAAIICRDGAFDIDDPEVAESAVALYDAGYRLTKQDGE